MLQEGHGALLAPRSNAMRLAVGSASIGSLLALLCGSITALGVRGNVDAPVNTLSNSVWMPLGIFCWGFLFLTVLYAPYTLLLSAREMGQQPRPRHALWALLLSTTWPIASLAVALGIVGIGGFL